MPRSFILREKKQAEQNLIRVGSTQ